MENRFATFKPTIEAQQPIQQPVKKTEVRAKTEKFEPKVDRAKNLQNQQVKKIAADEFDQEFEFVAQKAKQGGAQAKRDQGDYPKRTGQTDRRPEERGKGRGRAKFQGKAREEAHPMDRHSGTGRGNEVKKAGQGRGNWGSTQVQAFENHESKAVDQVMKDEVKDQEGDKKEGEKDIAKTSAPEQEVEEEEEEEGMSLDEFLASKKSANVKNQIRQAEKITDKNLEEEDNGKLHQETIQGQITDAQMYNPLKSENVELMGFQGGADEDDDARLKRSKTKGGRKHKKFKKEASQLQVNDDSFPSFQ